MATEEIDHFSETSNRLLLSIGRVVVAFQLLELWIAEALASALQMSAQDDRYLVSSAMSYRQKVELLCELYRRHHEPSRHTVDLSILKRAFLAAEEFRNRTVHSVWSVHSEPRRWVRTKASLRGRGGLELRVKPAEAEHLEAAAEAIFKIRGWEESDEPGLIEATRVLKAEESDA